MKYTVKWTDEALAGLTAVWLAAADRPAVNEAQDRIDQLLTRDPTRHGFDRAEGLYAIDIIPLRALYEISDAKHKVTIVAVDQLV